MSDRTHLLPILGMTVALVSGLTLSHAALVKTPQAIRPVADGDTPGSRPASNGTRLKSLEITEAMPTPASTAGNPGSFLWTGFPSPEMPGWFAPSSAHSEPAAKAANSVHSLRAYSVNSGGQVLKSPKYDIGTAVAQSAIGVTSGSVFTVGAGYLYGSVIATSECLAAAGYVIHGTEDAFFSQGLAGVGDMNNDGYRDFAIGGTGANDQEVTIYSGENGSILAAVTSPPEGLEHGYSIAGVGDVNRDGWNDILIGGPVSWSGMNNTGAVWLRSGQNLGVYLFASAGAASGDLHGWAVAGLGDINGDDYPDLCFSSPKEDANGTDAGRVYVRGGGAVTTSLYTWSGEAAGDEFGSTVAAAGDVDGDSKGDVLVGAPKNDAGGVSAGRAYVRSGANGSILYTLTGEAAGDEFGRGLAGLGDINQDGMGDFAVSAPFNDEASGNAGKIYVFSGANGVPFFTINGPAGNLGYSLSAAGDVDGDAFPDFVAGAPGMQRAFIFSGADGHVIKEFSPSGPGFTGFYGATVAGLGDINHDCVPDIAVGDPDWVQSENPPEGRAFIYQLVNTCQSAGADTDLDGIPDACDNCPFEANPTQADLSDDGVGDACGCLCSFPADLDGNGFVDATDLAFVIDIVFFGASDISDPGCPNSRADFNADGFADATDLAFLIDHVFFGQPGPIDPCL